MAVKHIWEFQVIALGMSRFEHFVDTFPPPVSPPGKAPSGKRQGLGLYIYIFEVGFRICIVLGVLHDISSNNTGTTRGATWYSPNPMLTSDHFCNILEKAGGLPFDTLKHERSDGVLVWDAEGGKGKVSKRQKT